MSEVGGSDSLGRGDRVGEPARGRIQAIDRAAALMAALATVGPAGAPLRSLAESASLNTSTAHSLLGSLMANCFAEQDPVTRHYRLGPRVVELSRVYLASVDLASVAAPIVREVWEKTQETVHLSVLRNRHRVDLVVLASPQILSINPTVTQPSRLGEPSPSGTFHGTAAGKILLAGQTDEDIRSLLSPGGITIGSSRTESRRADSVLAEIENVRRLGYAMNREEELPGVCGVAAPVRGPDGSTVAALCIGFPAARSATDYETFLRDAAVSAAARLSSLLSVATRANDTADHSGEGVG